MDETIYSINDYLSKMRSSIEKNLAELRLYKSDKKEYYLQVIEGYEWCVKSLQLSHDKHDIVINSKDLEIFKIFLEGFQNEDLIFLTDLLEYEIYPRAKVWSEKLLCLQIN